jgi:excisionase family DNA binding protein
METYNEIKRPSKLERKVAHASYTALGSALKHIKSDQAEVEIEIEESKDKIVVPLRALILLSDILKSMSQGKIISIVPIATEVTTQKAAEILGCSRPHLIKLLDEGKINFTKVGKHRRIKFEDIMNYKLQLKKDQKSNLIDIMNMDEESGLYDS